MVYIVTYENPDLSEFAVEGVFASKDKAELYIDYQKYVLERIHGSGEFKIVEIYLDTGIGVSLITKEDVEEIKDRVRARKMIWEV